jgi:hypothetical protein
MPENKEHWEKTVLSAEEIRIIIASCGHERVGKDNEIDLELLYSQARVSYLAGAASRDEEIEALKDKVKMHLATLESGIASRDHKIADLELHLNSVACKEATPCQK